VRNAGFAIQSPIRRSAEPKRIGCHCCPPQNQFPAGLTLSPRLIRVWNRRLCLYANDFVPSILFGDMNVLQLSRPAGSLRKALFPIAIIGALAWIPLMIFDFFRPTFIPFLARLEWPFSWLAPLLLIFFFADLLGEFRNLAVPMERSWSDQRHFKFVGRICLALAFLLPVLYFFVVQSMVEPVIVSE
jgi:hypothetical protein